MRLGRLSLILGIAAIAVHPAVSRAQFSAHFSLPKQVYSSGEPVFIDFEVQNTDSEGLRIQEASPYGACQGYHFEVAGLQRRDEPLCSEGTGGGCSFRLDVLGPGKTYSERVLLNHYFDLRKPGTYDVHATRQVSYQKANADLSVPGPSPRAEFEAYFTITIDEYGTADLRAVFEPFVHDLASSDLKQKFEAAEAIADLAPPFLESTLVEMLDSPNLQHYGVWGLRTLATPEAHQALAVFVKNSPPTDTFGPYHEAIRFLGEIGSPDDVDMLLAVAETNIPFGVSRALAIESAGEAGGDSAVARVAAELSQSSIEARQAAVRGLYLTGSRAAVSILIDLLRSPEERIGQTAAYGLEVLTHHREGTADAAANPAALYPAWARWWHRHSATAPVFKPTDCGDLPQAK